MLFLSAFGDDSADAKNERSFALACVIAPEPIWRALEGEWLDRTGGIPFHATDCDSNQGDYRDRPNLETKALYKDLSIMLEKSGAFGWGAGVDLAGHREFFPDVKEELSYHFCLIRIIDFFSAFASRHQAKEVKFSFDNRIDVKFNAAYLYSLMYNDPTQPHRERLCDEMSFLCSRKNPRIQIGDLYVREVMKVLENEAAGNPRPVRKSMAGLMGTTRFGADCYMREYFEDKKRRAKEIEEKAGFNQQVYIDWLQKHNLIDNVSNMFRFLTHMDAEDRKSPNGKTKRSV